MLANLSGVAILAQNARNLLETLPEPFVAAPSVNTMSEGAAAIHSFDDVDVLLPTMDIDKGQQWFWVELARGGCDNGKVITSNVIDLHRDGTLLWNNCRNKNGTWTYHFDNHWNAGLFYIEFSARNSSHARKHVFIQNSDTTAWLLPASHPAYKTYQWKPTSFPHANKTPIMIQKINIRPPNWETTA